jgi:two-component system NtrC family sensor kinase
MFEPASRNPKSTPVNELEALADAVLEAARVAGLGVIVSFDQGTTPRHVYVNDAAAEILGYDAEELVGAEAESLFAPEERERIERLTASFRRGDISPRSLETVMVRKSGECVPVEIAFSVVPLAGEPAVVTFVRDISERKLIETARRQSEARFRQLIEAAPDAIGVYRSGRLVYVNPALVGLFGRSSTQLVDHEAVDFVHVEDRAAALHAHDVEEGGEVPPTPCEYRVVHPDGHVVSVETVSIPIEYEGRPAVLGFSRDTTERKLFQAQIALSDRMATLGMLAAGVAHEINNPLAYATLNVEKLVRHLQRIAPADAAQEFAPAVAAARDGLARVAAIVRDLQNLSAPTSAERWPVDVSEVIDSALNLAMHAIRGRARIVRDYGDVPMLKTDPTRVGQIVLNLVFNAAQSFEKSDESRNVLSLGITHAASNEVVITVSDNGPGIPREQLARIFEPFYTTKSRGVGLGLAICQTLVLSLGGKLDVESEIGTGTKFTLRLAGPPNSR